MKKVLFIAAIAVLGITNANAQGGFAIGVHLGTTIGDQGDFYGLNYGVDASYLWNVDESFGLGVASGYTSFSGKEVDIPGFGSMDLPNASFVPIAASGKYLINEDWFIGADLGYALNVGDGPDGGFYYQPKVGWQGTALGVFAFYKGISLDGGSIASIGAGVSYDL